MFRITTTEGVEIGITDSVLYIRINKNNGCFNRCGREYAIGVAFKSTAYNLLGHAEIPNAKTVIVSEIDDVGSVLSNIKESTTTLSKQLAETDEAAIQLYETNLALEEITAEQDEAIIEIYEKIGELTNG